MGGDGHLLPAAARRARARRAAHAVADPRAVRPARGARRARSASRPSCATFGRPPTRLDIEGCRATGAPRAGGRAGALGEPTTRARRRASRRSAATCSARWPRTRPGPRRPPTPCCRCWPPTRGVATAGAAPGSPPHRRRLPGWGGGFWLPECAHAPGLGPAARRGRRRARRAWTSPTCSASARREHAARRCAAEPGPMLAPVDRATRGAGVERRWLSGPRRLPRLPPPHDPPPPPVGQRRSRLRPRGRARAWPREHAARLRVRAIARLDRGRGRPAAALCVCALDTELLGHWWYEGVAVAGRGARRGRRAGPGAGPTRRRARRATSRWRRPTRAAGHARWGSRATSRRGAARRCADLAWQRARRRAARRWLLRSGAGERALRELLALQASDWAFMVSRGLAGDYPRERAGGHARELDARCAR